MVFSWGAGSETLLPTFLPVNDLLKCCATSLSLSPESTENNCFTILSVVKGYEGFSKPLCALDDPAEHTKKLVGNIAGDFRLKWGAYTSSSGEASVYCLQPQPGLRSQYGTGQNIRLQEMCSLWSPCYSSSTNFIQRHQHRYSGVYKKLRVDVGSCHGEALLREI